MRWRNQSALILVLILVNSVYALTLETHSNDETKAPNSDTIIHHPTASLSIAGDLKDVKLKASIAQLVRALQHPKPHNYEERKSKLELKTPQNTPTTNVHSSQSRKLQYGQSPIPQPITISSQPIQINTANKTGGKRSRSMTTSVDSSGVKTIEGIRVPDDEHDKHYTWRNARVIKGFLVPNGQSPNPHKKRQVLITDPQAYLAAAAAAQASGAPTIIDGSMQMQQAQQSSRQASQFQQLSNNAAGSPSSSYAYNTQQTYQQQQPVNNLQPQPHQYKSQQLTNSGGQTAAYAYAQQQGQQMYVLQDANAFLQQYSPVQQAPQPVSQLSHSQLQQSQFSSRSGEPSSQQSSQQSQPSSQAKSPQEYNLQQQIAQAQAAVNAIQQLQHSSGQAKVQSSSDSQQQQVQSRSGQAQDQVQSASSVVTPQVAQAPQEFSSNSGATQYIVQTPNQPGSSATVYQIPQNQHHQYQDIQGKIVNNYQRQEPTSAAQSGFVIQPQTYIAGPGGQSFTIPVPIPADQVQQSQAQQRHDWYQNPQHHQQQPHGHHQQQKHQRNHQLHGKDKNFANRVMDALHINKKALERVDTATAVVPALASTGIFLGLSALAAGWYLSRGNREVGIVRRTGKPAGGSHRVRRDVALPGASNYPQEVDQATFFQSIIQQSLEKTQQQYEDQVEPVYSPQEPVYNREPEPERYARPSKHNRPQPRPQSRDDDYYPSKKHGTGSTYAQEKSGMTIGSSKNFAKVFIPALILGVSVISITALIFGWYITGANREIAFLEPASYSRKKRSLFGPKDLSDGWLQKTITAIHGNPYDRMPLPTSKSLLPHPFLDRETSKTSDLEFKISNTGLTGVLAGGAIIAIVALGLANSFSAEGANTRQFKGQRSSNAFTSNPNALKHLRAPRSIHESNDLNDDQLDNPGFLSRLLSTIEITEENIMTKLQESAGLFQQKSPCAKRLLCEVMSSEDDDTIKSMEKRMATYINMLPKSYADSLKLSFGEIVSSIYKRDCSMFACKSHGVISSTGSNSNKSQTR